MSGTAAVAGSNRPSPMAVIVRQGRLLDFIDGETQRKETPRRVRSARDREVAGPGVWIREDADRCRVHAAPGFETTAC